MYDIVVIGSGPGGYVAAVCAAQLGFRVACVEKGELGGTCLNIGCIPSKALLYSSEQYHFLQKEAEDHGIVSKKTSLDFGQMQRRKQHIVDGLVGGVRGLFQRHGVELVAGCATFISDKEIEVVGKEKRRLEAKIFILATGSEPIPLPFASFDEKVILSSTGALALSNVPKRLIVIGAGVIGLELASVFNRLGSNVTVVEMLPYICPTVDREIGKVLAKSLKKQGVEFQLNSRVTEVKQKKGGVVLTIEKEGAATNLDADKLLIAIGRRPYSEGLGLEKIGVKMDRGFVVVDSQFRTTVPHIYAIGDLIEGAGLAHRASEEGMVLVEGLAGHFSKVDALAIPNILYTQPEVAGVGLTEEEARQAGILVTVGRCPLLGNPRGRATGQTEGLVKVIAAAQNGALLGLHIVSPNASEMIGEGVIALEKRATLQELADAPHGHPTFSEAIKEAALQGLGRAVHL